METNCECHITSFEDYQALVTRLMRGGPHQEQVFNFLLGLAGETGEVCDLLKKHYFHNHTYNPDDLRKELGDVLFYVVALAKTMGWTLADVAQTNAEKLSARYPNGFDPERSQNRK